MRILLVDDHVLVRRGMVEILAREFPGAVFGEAGTARDGLQRVRESAWDVALLDLGLPDRSGLDLLKDIKGIRPRLPAIILSAYPESQYGTRSLRAGASGYLNKETAPEELVRAIKKVLAGGRYVSVTLAEDLAAQLARRSPALPHEALSDRELEVLRLIAAGKRLTEIAEGLNLSPKTISTYRSRILEKLRLRTNADLTAYSLRHDLLDR